MIGTTLSALSASLSAFLRKEFQLPDNRVTVQSPADCSERNEKNQICLSLVHVERELNAGISFKRSALSDTLTSKSSPPWLLNLYVMFAVVFSEKQYEESLHFLSAVILFLQVHSTFTLPHSAVSLALEPVNLSFNELSNIWSLSGGRYYPSVCCKVRFLTADAAMIKEVIPSVVQKEISYE